MNRGLWETTTSIARSESTGQYALALEVTHCPATSGDHPREAATLTQELHIIVAGKDELNWRGASITEEARVEKAFVGDQVWCTWKL